MTEQKIDSLLKAVEALKKDHSDGQRDLRARPDYLEKEVAMGQEDAT